MIPKVIHYCWFGRNPLPPSALKCIESWHRFFPDYEIKEWNEDNFDVNSIPYTSQAYEAKKYAFVSDYARFWILYRYGGIYFDTDVEVIKNMDDIIEAGPFMGCEIGYPSATIEVNPGLGIGAFPGMEAYKSILDSYSKLCFLNSDGTLNEITVVKYTTGILYKYGLKNISGIQTAAGIRIYPKDYFNPLDNATGRLVVTSNTRSIHWYAKTWLKHSKLRTRITRFIHRVFGVNSLAWLKKLVEAFK